MLKPLLLAALAVAQVPMPPMGAAPMRGPTPVEPSGGITVNASGLASAPATEAALTLRISTRNNAIVLTAQMLQPIVDALTKAGADSASIQLPPYLVGQARTNMATISATVHHPTQTELQNGMLILANAFASMPTLLLNAVDVRLTADNCLALQRKAETLAIAQARSRAAFLAQQVGGKLGPAMSIDEHDGGAFGGQGTCTSAYSVGPYGPPPVGFADMLTVKTFSNITMRFAIVHAK